MSLPEREYGVIASGRTCAVCGYALIGLKQGGQCPECGAPISPPARLDDAMSAMPESVIRAYRFGAIFATIGAAGLVPAIALEAAGYAIIAPMGYVACSLLWFAGMCWLTTGFETPASAAYGFSSRGRLRVAARWLQLAGVAYASLLLVRSAITTPGAMDPFLAGAAPVAGLATLGAVVTAVIVLHRLAVWTRDDFAESAFNFAAFGFPVVILLLNIGGPLNAFIIRLAVAVLGLVTLLAVPAGMLSLARSLDYAVTHAQDAEVREERRSERQKRHDRRMQRRLKHVESPSRTSDREERTP